MNTKITLWGQFERWREAQANAQRNLFRASMLHELEQLAFRRAPSIDGAVRCVLSGIHLERARSAAQAVLS